MRILFVLITHLFATGVPLYAGESTGTGTVHALYIYLKLRAKIPSHLTPPLSKEHQYNLFIPFVVFVSRSCFLLLLDGLC